ncbi:TonB-dependent receptor domain-containing protein [Aurantiacibacter aquimixticola]|uniref:TonB-dependent receptor n=1 Tax=Aurantiacibacter aquimixticola TaxID=1958945 RepID=A0A419RSL8_9SPHN|nr:TonB-dependent receptor [Aurantiacibacter aquimixticola]RJY08781.1 TonB-dependent receptor [Aurantiacibacter aquimixticola]
MFNRKTKASLLASSVIFGSLIAAPVYAQDQDPVTPEDPTIEPQAAEEGERIVVTGSRIQRRNVETAAPVTVVDSEEFALSGTVNVENVVNTLPQVVPGVTSFSNNPGNGTASLNLRGLGANRNLLLVNGRRWMFYDTGQIVDLNTIPQFLLESVDVVTGGASAVYGSDALAGVVNFRLRELDGAEVGGQYSITDRGDGDRYQIHGAIGADFSEGRGNVTVFGEYYNRDEIFQGDREFSAFALGGNPLEQLGSSLPPETRLTYRGDGDTDDTAFEENNNLGIFDPQGQIRAYETPRDLYNFAPVNYLQLPQERYLIGGYASYEIVPQAELYTEVTYVNNRVDSELAPTPILINTTLDIEQLADDGFINDDTADQFRQLDESESGDAQDDGLISVQIRRRLQEAGGRRNLDERNAFRVLGGLRGDITDFLNYDAYYMFARTRNANIQQGNASVSRFTAAVNGTGDTQINIFGRDTLSPEDVDVFRIQAQNGDISELQVASAVISGTLGDFALGAAEPIGFAVGGEYREVFSRFIPDEFLASGDVAGFNAGQPTEGGYDVKEVFGEVSIPFETESGMRVELTGAGRYSDYSLERVGGVWTYAGGIEFSPIEDITFRGQYQRAVRAPNVGELFQGQAIGFPGALDPCAGNGTPGGGPTPSGALLDLCLDNGVPEDNIGLVPPSGNGPNPIVQPDPQTAAFFGGNPDLFEETSDSYSFGIVLQPTAIPGFTLTADYFDIKIEDAIVTPSLQTQLNICYNDLTSLDSDFCSKFENTRDETGAFDRFNAPVLGGENIASLETSGIDLQVAYDMDLGFSLLGNGASDLNLSLLATWTESALFAPLQDEPDDVIECAGQFGLTCGEPQAAFKWTSRASYVDGPLTFSTRWRHLSAVDDDDDGTTYIVDRIGAYDLIDLTLSYDFMEAVTFTVGVNNLFDTLPTTPEFNDAGQVVNETNTLLLGDFNNAEQSNTYPSTYDVLGRDFFASVLVRF